MARPKQRAGAGDDDDLVRLYLAEIGSHPLLTKDDESRLATAMELGANARSRLEADRRSRALGPGGRRALRVQIRAGERAKDAFVTANLRLVVSIAKRYQWSGLSLLDLVQDGNLGLLHAVDKFDHRKGFKFSTYATWWIRQAITRGIANTGRTIRLPVHAGEQVFALDRASAHLRDRLGRDPTATETAAALGWTESRVDIVRTFSRPPLSLSAPLADDGDDTIADLIGDPTAVDPAAAALLQSLSGDLDRILAPLTDRERLVLRLRFGLDGSEPQTLDRIGARLNLTRERIRQIEAAAMSKLRHPSTMPEGWYLTGW